MALKNARLARIENLSLEKKKELGLDKGLVIIESRNPDLTENIIPIKEGGIREYLTENLGEFNDIEIEE